MSVSFNRIASNLRIPTVQTEISNSGASQSAALMPFRGLLIGQKRSGAGTASANTLYKVSNADAVLTLAGRGSMLHRQAKAWFAANKSTELWIAVLADNPAGVAASGTMTFAGTATADGTLALYIGGVLIQVAVSNGDTAATVAANVEAALGRHARGTVTLVGTDAADTVTIGTTTFTGATGAVTPGTATYSVDTSDTAAAASLASQIAAHAVASLVVTATSALGAVSLRAVEPGLGGNSIPLTSSDAIEVAVSGSGTLTGATAETELPTTANLAGSVVTISSRHKGAVGNEIDIRVNYQDGEATPAGITVAVGGMANGVTNPTLTSLIAAMGDRGFNIISHPYTDATSLTALETELEDRFGPARDISGVAFTAKSATFSALGTLGESRNSPHSSIVPTNGSPTATFEYAAHVAAVAALYGNIDPARPFQTLPLPWVLPPSEVDQFTAEERNLLLFDGISTTRVGAGGLVQIDRLITTYQLSAAGSPDASYLDVTTMLTLMYLRFAVKARLQTAFPRHKLANDGTQFGAGQAVVTPLIIKAELIAWFRQMEDLALVEDFAQFKNDLVVERDGSDVSRVNIILPPNLVNGFIVGAISVQFRL